MGLRAPSTSLLNLGHHPPSSPGSLFSHLSERASAAPGFCVAHTASVHARECGVILVPGASSFALLLLVLSRLCLLCQPPGQVLVGGLPLVTMLCSCSFALVFAQNIVLTAESAL